MSRRRFFPLALLAASLILPSLLARSAGAEEHNKLSPAEIADGWLLLFDGETLFGWEAASKADWRVENGTITVGAGEPGLLCTTSDFGDYLFKAEFRHEPQTNSGVFLRTVPRPTDPKVDCYELNIANESVSPFPTGSFVGRKRDVVPPESSDWRSFEVAAQGGRFVVQVDGRQTLDYVDPKPLGRGRIGLQLNSGPVAFRNVKLKPLGLAPLFNGRDLAGWKPYPGKPSLFSVNAQGELNIKNGPGQLETEARFADFVVQLEVFSAGRGLNSGLFFRNVPGQLWQGYESQIHNGYREGDRTKPVDCGTGGFYRRQNARRVVADDFQWFSKTVVVSGRHMASWVNGYQVSDWSDPRGENENPRQGLRLAAGTLALQGHDPTTDLSFRNIRAGELAGRE